MDRRETVGKKEGGPKEGTSEQRVGTGHKGKWEGRREIEHREGGQKRRGWVGRRKGGQ